MEESEEILEEPTSAFSGEGSSGPEMAVAQVNPYDSVGMLHNSLVTYVLERVDDSSGELDSQLEEFTFTFLDSIGLNYDQDKAIATFASIQSNSGSLNSVNWRENQFGRINDLELSDEAKGFFMKMLEAIDSFDYSNPNNSPFIDITELEIEINSSSIIEEEKVLLLMGCSYVRWSSYLWYSVYHGRELEGFNTGLYPINKAKWCWQCTVSEDLTTGLEAGVLAVVGAAVTGVGSTFIPLFGGATFLIAGGYASVNDFIDQYYVDG